MLLSGDIAVAPTLGASLQFLEAEIQRPIFFVLGNHDYYDGSREGVHASVRNLCARSSLLHWLDDEPDVIRLNGTTGLVGAGGWADGGYGDYHRSTYEMADYRSIGDFRELDRGARLEVMQGWANAAATRLERLTTGIRAEHFRQLLVVTHVPPFPEVCLYQGKLPTDDTVPHYASKRMGQALLRIATATPSVSLKVLCGHSHEQAAFHPLANLSICSAKARYGAPEIQAPL